MAQSLITWTPTAGANAGTQTIQYKISSSPTWITFGSTLAIGVSTVTITGLDSNRIYDFQVLNNCPFGGPSSSGSVQRIIFICPTLTVTSTATTVSTSFTLTGVNDMSKIDVKLLASDGVTTLATQTVLAPTNITYNIAPFTGLFPSTVYKIQLVLYAGPTFVYSNNCAISTISTTAAPTCFAPTGVTAVLS